MVAMVRPGGNQRDGDAEKHEFNPNETAARSSGNQKLEARTLVRLEDARGIEHKASRHGVEPAT